MNTEHIWQDFLNKVKGKVSIMTFNYLFKDLKFHSFDDGKVIIVVPDNERLLQNIKENYTEIIEEVINDLFNDTCEIEYVYKKDLDKLSDNKTKAKNKPIIKEKVERFDEEDDSLESDITNYQYNSNFNPLFTFDTFVVGESNKRAYGTAQLVAQNPGKIYNPYFLYAKSGLGKTHLMHAIGNYIVTHSDKRVLYVSAEQFKNDFTSIAVNSGKGSNLEYLEAFRDKYRNVDVLIIDDIQFLDNAIKTQQEFNNTFNALHDNHKQIIMASDKSINDYKMLEERLKTRFKWGLTESIMSPEFELKKNIIKNKIMINDFDLNLSEDVINFIANNCGNDIRNLEGSVIRLLSYKACLNIDEITLDIAKEALTEFTTETVYRVNSVSKIIDIVAKYFNLEVPVIKGKMRKKNIADARAIAMYLSRIMTDESLERIGLEFGGRDHTTVIHSFEKINKEINNNPKLAEEIKLLKEKICE